MTPTTPAVLDQFKADYGTPISVLFFDLQPNQL